MTRPSRLGRGADAPLLTTIETPGLGNRSYLVEADGVAIAVDVQRDLDRVEQVLRRRRLRLAAVVETHVHNDYVTGGLALARRYGAEYVVPAGPELAFDAVRGHDGDLVDAGPLRLRVISSPGHTDAHATYSLHVGDTPALAAFTGGSLLLGATGRTDLLGAHLAEELARAQYWSARRLSRLVPSTARLLPTHGFGSFCSAGTPATSSGDALGHQLTVNPAFLLDEEAFVADLLGRLGAYPSYFPLMAPRNVAGPDAADLSGPVDLDLEELERRREEGAWILDVRPRAEHLRAHVPGSINVDAAGALATWTGWTVPVTEPLVVVAQDRSQLAEAQRELVRIGVDHLAGAHVGRLRPGTPGLASRRRVRFGDLAAALRRGDEPALIDVREDAEWRDGHVRGARHIAAHDVLAAHEADAVPESPWIYCRAGFRASLAASLLALEGVECVVVDDDLARAGRAAVPWCEGDSCPDDRCTADEQAATGTASGRDHADEVAAP